jgi:hypothetical protein
LEELEKMRDRIDEIALLNLWIVFERFIIEYLSTRLRTPAIGEASQFTIRLIGKFEESIERWRFDEVLDLFKGWIDSDQIGRAKQICSYRNWIAHRNEKGPRPTITDPKTAMLVLGDIMDSVLQKI